MSQAMSQDFLLTVTEGAQVYFRHLIKQQQAEDLAISIARLPAGHAGGGL